MFLEFSFEQFQSLRLERYGGYTFAIEGHKIPFQIKSSVQLIERERIITLIRQIQQDSGGVKYSKDVLAKQGDAIQLKAWLDQNRTIKALPFVLIFYLFYRFYPR